LRDHEDPEVRRQADLLVTECDRIARVVEQLLSFGRRKPAAIAPCTLVEPVRTVIDLLGHEARRRGITLVADAADRSRIEADPDQLQQIALNLINNALAATPRGGTVTVRVERNERQVELSIRDTGPGIPTAMQPRLFEPFFTTRATEGGSGLGLAVVRAIATEHRASITVMSDFQGTEFVVRFPLFEEVTRD
jgi:signal transduction histidine kinase